MELFHDTCLSSLIVNSIFVGTPHSRFIWNKYNKDKFLNNKLELQEFYNIDSAKFLLQLSLIVTENNYYEQQEVTNLPILLRQGKRYDFYYDQCPLPLISKGLPNISANKSAMVASAFFVNNTLLIIFTGTTNGCMATLDLSYAQIEAKGITNYSNGCKVHKGIYLIYQSIRNKLIDKIKPLLTGNPKVIISGHSLGGGLSQLCAFDLAFYNPIHYSFASPRIFNEVAYLTYSNLVKYSYRITNLDDIVVMTPLPIMPNGDVFFHVGEPIYFQRNLGEYSKNHGIAYIKEFGI